MNWHTPLGRRMYRAIEALAVALRPGTIQGYKDATLDFLLFLQRNFPAVEFPDQLRRPHLLAWMRQLAAHQPSYAPSSRARRLCCIRRLFDELACYPRPPRPGLISSLDIPRRDFVLPRPLSPEDDDRIQAWLRHQGDLPSNALLLQRGTGLRTGELAELAPDCLHHIGGEDWAVRVPACKLHAERWVPAAVEVRDIVARIAALRAGDAASQPHAFLLPRPHGRQRLMLELRTTIQRAAHETGCCAQRPVPYQLRHTFATDLLRRGVSLIGIMHLLGHKTPRMTLCYLQITDVDVRKQFYAARQQPRYSLPPSPAGVALLPAESLSLPAALHASLRLLDALGRQPASSSGLAALRRRLLKLIRAAEILCAHENGSGLAG